MKFEADLLIPADGSTLGNVIAPRSALVGRPLRTGDGLMVYYEGNLYDAANLRRWQERVTCAAGRMFLNYPTVAKTVVMNPGELIRVGSVRTDDPRVAYEVRVDPNQFEALSAYTGERVEDLVSYEIAFGTALPDSAKDIVLRGDREMIRAAFVAASGGSPGSLIMLSRAFRVLRDARLHPGMPVEYRINGKTVVAGRIGDPLAIALPDAEDVLKHTGSRAPARR